MNQYSLQLIAYVGSGVDDPTPLMPEGTPQWVNFGMVYRGRPAPSRFAIIRDSDDDYLVIDLFDVILNDDKMTFTIPPDALWVFPTLDAAMMTAKLKL